MQVTRLQLGVYANQQPFCLYLFPLTVSSNANSPRFQGQDSSLSPSRTSTTTRQPFYRLRDIDVIFFESRVGYMYNSGQIPQVYFDTPGYCFHERSGDTYLAARAISETATRLGHHLLAEFCKLGKPEMLSGAADRLLNSVSIAQGPLVEAEFEFVSVESRVIFPSSASGPATPPRTRDSPLMNNVAPLVAGHPGTPPVNTRKRMSLEEVLDNDVSDNKRGNNPIKQEPSPAYSGGGHSNPSSPNQMPRSPHSPSSPNLPTADLTALLDTRMRKKRRVAISSITSNNIKVTNNPEVMEQVRNTLKLKQQQKAIIEARQQKAQQQMLQQQQNHPDRRHSVPVSKMSPQVDWDPSRIASTAMPKRNPTSTHNRSNRNSRNLSVFAPPYNAQMSNTASGSSRSLPRRISHQRSPKIYVSRAMPTVATPITPTMAHRPSSRFSVSGCPLSANSAFRPAQQTQNIHSASKSASINGLISPHNVEFPTPGGSASPTTSSDNARSRPSTSPISSVHNLLNGDQTEKESFSNLFESFYDTLSDSQNLKSTLEDQIRKTSTLLQTLQSSGTMIEGLVRGHFREMQREMVKDLMTLEKRIAKVEERVRHSAMVGMSPSPPPDTDRRLSDISTSSSDMAYPNRESSTIYRSSSGGPCAPQTYLHPASAVSPPLSAVSSRSGAEEMQSKDYEGVLSALKARLESLERRMSYP